MRPSSPQVIVEERPALDQFDLQFIAQMAEQLEPSLYSALPGTLRDTALDFIAANRQPAPAKDLALPFAHKIVTWDYLSARFGDEPPLFQRRFQAAYPDADGFWSFSRVGFNCSLEQALIFTYHSYGPPGGTGILHLLSRHQNTWLIEREVSLFES